MCGHGVMCVVCRLLLRVHQELQGKEDGQVGSDIWLEFESDLWTKHLPHLREEIYGDGQFVFAMDDKPDALDLNDPSDEEMSDAEDEIRPNSTVQANRGGAEGDVVCGEDDECECPCTLW